MTIDLIGGILLAACLVAMLSRRLRLPYSVGLVAAGLGLAGLGLADKLVLTPRLVIEVLLPPLVFEAALQLKWRPFRRGLPVALTLAFPGVVVTAAVVAAGMHLVAGWSWLGGGLFGFLIAATDPVSVIAAFREMKVDHKLSLLVESVSLLNDGSAAVGFTVLVGLAQGGAASPAAIAGSAAWMVLGGIAVGAAAALAVLLLAGRTDDRLVEITLTTLAAYGGFLGAEHLHMSGVLAAVAAGLIVGNVGWRGPISDEARRPVLAFWDYAAFLANSVVFILIGAHTSHHLAQLFTPVSALAIVLVIVAQASAVYPLCALFIRSGQRVSLRFQHVLVWGGLRGALSLALALSLPDTLPEKGPILLAAFTVVVFSLFVQGLTMAPFIRRLGLTG